MPRLAAPLLIATACAACAGRARFGAGPVLDTDGRVGARVAASFAFGVQESDDASEPTAFERLLAAGLALDGESAGQPVLLRSHLHVEQNWRSPVVGFGLGAGVAANGVGHRAFGPSLSLRAARPLRGPARLWTSVGAELSCDLVIVRGPDRRRLGSCALLAVFDDGMAELEPDDEGADSGD